MADYLRPLSYSDMSRVSVASRKSIRYINEASSAIHRFGYSCTLEKHPDMNPNPDTLLGAASCVNNNLHFFYTAKDDEKPLVSVSGALRRSWQRRVSPMKERVYQSNLCVYLIQHITHQPVGSNFTNAWPERLWSRRGAPSRLIHRVGQV